MPRSYPEARKWYGTAEWKELRRITLVKHPVCTRCHSRPSTIVDHKIPHKGDRDLFFDPSNLTGLDKQCHDKWKKNMEFGKMDTACTEEGYPLDSSHPWN